MSLWDRACEYCWKTFKPEHSYNKYCSRECSAKAKSFLKEISCATCWEYFKPKTSKTVCCSMSCAQVYNWNNKSEEEKAETVDRLAKSNPETISKINLEYKQLFIQNGYKVKEEFILWPYSYDFIVNNILVEVSPFAYHSSNWAPKKKWVKPKHPRYHYNKAKYAIDRWYKIIEFWTDWMTDDELFYLLQNLKQTTLGEPQEHWVHRKTQEHLIDSWQDEKEMLAKWYVKIYDAWEKYIFNSTNIN